MNKGRISKPAVAAMGILLTSLLSAVPARASESPLPKFDPPRRYYLALGDSVAFGFQISRVQPGNPPSAFDHGYADDLAASLRNVRPRIQTINDGCPGESTTTFLEGGCPWTQQGFGLHNPYVGSPMDAAVAFLRTHRGQVSPISLTLWGNDVVQFVASCGGDPACITANAPAAIAHLTSNLSTILGRLRAAAPEAEILVTGPWNSFVGEFPTTDPLFQALDTAMARSAAGSGAGYVDLFPTFNPQTDIAAETNAICTLTLLCSLGDSHPSDLGYQTIANAVWDASGYACRLRGGTQRSTAGGGGHGPLFQPRQRGTSAPHSLWSGA